ncbi:hypothetical protein [Leptolyngbya sp. NIES-2104]|uniref:hypothetical protein n=1 Tax=Leptolyngbya sp. NIES-2104 TaxID=1552121 RepID=UPI0006EC91D2|nr:hypothetical protein [Leptolyngbya sp. NIES-2104]GAP95934.1 hypothetical protein NIES2104_24620 [Leptolyngbya sp. NIES-2104]
MSAGGEKWILVKLSPKYLSQLILPNLFALRNPFLRCYRSLIYFAILLPRLQKYALDSIV